MHPRARDLRAACRLPQVLKYQGSDGRRSLWDVQCVCGSRVVFSANELQKLQARGVQASCGCRRWQTVALRVTRHGMSRHPAYAVYRSMLDRCTRPSHPAWKNYGAVASRSATLGETRSRLSGWTWALRTPRVALESQQPTGLLRHQLPVGHAGRTSPQPQGAILVKGKPLAQLAAETGSATEPSTPGTRQEPGGEAGGPLKPKSSTC